MPRIKKTLRLLIILLHCIAIVFLAFSCANIVPPMGGAKDITPPKLIKSTPENHSVNFESKTIKLIFDEYIKLSNLNQQLLISPPLKNIPDITVKRKTVVIKINDTLSPNTTYNIYFGNAIADITEGNAFANFSYVFSTGDFLDSMSVSGKVLIAETLKPAEEVYVMLYDSIYDSIPYISKPAYITKTDKQGRFQLNNLRNIFFKIFALNDANNNLIFDLPNEKIAYLDTTIIPFYFQEKKIKSSIIDTTLKNEVDTIKETNVLSDTLVKDSAKHVSYNLFLFEQKDTTQKVLKKSLERKGLVSVVFRHPVSKFKITYPDLLSHDEIITEEFNKTLDTLKLWIKSPAPDTLFALLFDNDSLIDTLLLNIIPRESKKPIKPKLLISTNIINNADFDYFNSPYFEFSNPLDGYTPDNILLLEDSVEIKAQFEFSGNVNRKLILKNELKQETSYEINFPSGVFSDIFGNEHDSLQLKFKTKKEEDYGLLILNLTLPHQEHDFIVYLLDEKNLIFREDIITESKKIEYTHMKPGKYSLKVVYDENNDGKWTTGNYLNKIQPEKVFFNKGDIVTRANWDVEIEVIVE